MALKRKDLRGSFIIFAFVLIIHFISIIKVSHIVGSYSSFFTLSHTLLPLTGLFGFEMSSIIILLKGFMSNLFFGVPLFGMFYHIPTLGSSAYWSFGRNWYIRFFLPLACLIAFIVHPIGVQAWPYGLYWFVPILFFVMNSSSILCHALSSTFIAHALGSVLWIYMMPTTPSFWMFLMPVVLVERLFFAASMTLAYYGFSHIKMEIKKSMGKRRKVVC